MNRKRTDLDILLDHNPSAPPDGSRERNNLDFMLGKVDEWEAQGCVKDLAHYLRATLYDNARLQDSYGFACKTIERIMPKQG